MITEKATTLSEHNQVVFRVAIDATKPEIKAAVEGLFGVKVLGGQHAGAEGQDQALQGPAWPALGRQEGVSSTLAEGQSIDFTTGLA